MEKPSYYSRVCLGHLLKVGAPWNGATTTSGKRMIANTTYRASYVIGTHNGISQPERCSPLLSMAQLCSDRCCRQCETHTLCRGEVVRDCSINGDSVAKIVSLCAIMGSGVLLSDWKSANIDTQKLACLL